MATWIRQEQQDNDNYTFSGQFVISHAVRSLLPKVEIISIYYDILKLVQEKGGIDSIQVYTDERNRTLHFIDQSNKHLMINEGDGTKENLCVLYFAHEY